MQTKPDRSTTTFPLIGAVAASFLLLCTLPAGAHDDDHKRLESQKLKMSQKLSDSSKRKFQYKTRDQLRINDLSIDPSVAGSSLVVRGLDPGDGSTGVLNLDPDRWRRVGNKGWLYKDNTKFLASQGINKILIKEGKVGGSLQIKAKGAFWPYDIVQAQGTVEIFLAIGTDVYCAQYDPAQGELSTNEAGRVAGRDALPPADCTAVCGNGILELGEQCDDGNDDDTDTCSTACLGCLPSQVEYDSTYEGIQELVFDSAVYDCSTVLCHSPVSQQGGLDLTEFFSYDNLVGVPSQIDPDVLRVFPGDQDLSLLYTKLAAKTLGTQTIGTPMPQNPETLSVELLEAIRLWIRAGAPEQGVVEGTAELLGACLPPPSPAKIPQPDPPPAGEGIQFAMPGYDLPSQSETELCVASYYDLTAPGVVPPQYRVPCPGAGGANNPSEECFAWKGQFLAQDPQSHHSIIHIYTGDFLWSDPGFGPWECYGGADDKQPCDPTLSGQCPDGVCGGRRQDTTACIGYGPSDYGFAGNNSPTFSGSQESTATQAFPAGVYQLLPLQGVIVWNSHAFNLTNEDMDMEAWLNLDFTDQQIFPAQQLFNDDHIFVQRVPPYETREYCYTHTFAEGTRLFQISSHMHKRGKRWRYFAPPQTPCPSASGCSVGNPSDKFYESTDYSDPLYLDYDPPWHFTGSVNDRTIKFCTLYDNGSNDPAEVKRASTSPCPANGCGVIPGGPCGGPGGDPRNPDKKCLGGPNVGQVCTTDSQCPTSVCDACDAMGGVTTEDEMFIAIGSFYVDP